MKVILILLLMTNVCLAEECFDYKKDAWRPGKMRCGTSCYECSSEDQGKFELLKEYRRYFGDAKPSEVINQLNKESKYPKVD